MALFTGAAGPCAALRVSSASTTAAAVPRASALALYDSHSHVLAGLTVPSVVASTCERDWAAVAAAVAAGPAASRAAYGIHPWHAHRAGVGWAAALEAQLVADPTAVVGETGLDKVARTPDTGRVEWDAQAAVFAEHLRLAVELGRPLTLHCVQAPGPVYDALARLEALPPAVSMHSYTGSVQFLKQLQGLERRRGCAVFFGFSRAVNCDPRHLERLKTTLEAAPDNRILVESDITESGRVKGDLEAVLAVVAEAKGLSVDEAARLTEANARRFLRIVPGPAG